MNQEFLNQSSLMLPIESQLDLLLLVTHLQRFPYVVRGAQHSGIFPSQLTKGISQESAVINLEFSSLQCSGYTCARRRER
jgi:hypothetical protein